MKEVRWEYSSPWEASLCEFNPCTSDSAGIKLSDVKVLGGDAQSQSVRVHGQRLGIKAKVM